MRIAWFTHRYHPCVGGAENLRPGDGPAVRRGGARGRRLHQRRARPLVLHRPGPSPGRRAGRVGRRRGPGPSVRGPAPPVAALRRPAPELRPALADPVPRPRRTCRSCPGIERVRGDYDAVFAVGFPYTVFSYAALPDRPRGRRAADPDAVPPPGHARRPGNRKHYTRPHQVRLLAEADTVVVADRAGGRGRRRLGHPARPAPALAMAVEHEAVTGGDRDRLRDRLGDPRRPAGRRPARRARPEQGDHRPGPGRRPAERQPAGRRPDPPGPRRHRLARLRAVPGRAAGPRRRRWLHRSSARSRRRPAPTSTRRSTCSRCRRGPTRSGSSSSKPGPTACRWSPPPRGGCPRSSATARPACSSRSATSTAWPGRSAALLDDPALARRLGEAGRGLVARGYTWDDRFATLRARVVRSGGGEISPQRPRSTRRGRPRKGEKNFH